ncbi:MAG: hypothetical protein WCK67_07270 [bacterium]
MRKTENNKTFSIKKSSMIKERINLVSSHMFKQYKEHLEATTNTGQMFERILKDMEEITYQFQESFAARSISHSSVYCKTDADRSVGIVNILWHSISLTTRGNTQPQALFREGMPPLFTGRILALNGDFHDAALDLMDQEYPDILKCEIASLYVPADSTAPAIMKIKHLGDKEFLLNSIDAPKQFLLRVIEIICGGGLYHENEPDCGCV